MSEWINVKDRLPQPHESVLITDGKKINRGWIGWDNKSWYDGFEDTNYESVDYGKVIAWMPLPAPPEAEVQK